MDAHEALELKEKAEEAAHDRSLRAATFTMSFLAILVALTSVLGHRTHTEAGLVQTRSSDEWNLYQAKKIRQSDTSLAVDLLSTLSLRDEAAAKKLATDTRLIWKNGMTTWPKRQKKATELEAEVALIERRASRFDLGEALLEIALVITSITLLTRSRTSCTWVGYLAGLGLICAASVVLVH